MEQNLFQLTTTVHTLSGRLTTRGLSPSSPPIPTMGLTPANPGYGFAGVRSIGGIGEGSMGSTPSSSVDQIMHEPLILAAQIELKMSHF